MVRLGLVAISLFAILAHDVGQARGDSRNDVTGFFGVRLFSATSGLGSPTPTSLANAVTFGARVSRPLRPWLAGEAELPVLVTGSRDDEATVFFLDPRIHARFSTQLRGNVQPVALVGFGLPIALSSDRPRFNSDILPELYVGVGANFLRASGWSVRFDARVGLLPGRTDYLLGADFEILISLYRWRPRQRQVAAEFIEDFEPDADGDGIFDDDDACPRREEDVDEFEDDDGCPDIDDDRDEVLDIADQCRMQPEVWNGFEDEDGCPDVVPDEVIAAAGELVGVGFEKGSEVLRRRSYKALDELVAVLIAYPSVRGRIVVASQAAGALDLAQARADAVKYYLLQRGVGEFRLGAVGVEAAPEEGAGKKRAPVLVEFHIRRRERNR